MALARLWVLLLLVPLHIDCDKVSEGTGMFSPSDDIEYAAIKTIHKQLDDNADGSVDFSESAEFVLTELCGSHVGGEGEIEGETACSGSEKSLKFHQTDTQITSTELWVTWHKNEVFNWTTQDVLNWLEHYVELPQYSSTFIENQITGRHLPHIAINSGQILQNSLSITDGQHKQKIQLRAMDVILFGPPVQRGRWKDTILEISVAFILCGTIYALWQRRRSKAHIDSFMEDLRLKEEEIKRLTSKFEAIEQELTDGPADECQEDIRNPSPPIMMSPAHNSSDSEDEGPSLSHCKSCSSQAMDSLSQAQQNVELLQHRVWVLEEELEVRNRSYRMLQELLPECQQKEREQLEFRKSVGEEQMARAQRACDKIKKRRSSLFGSFHLANSSVLDEAGLQITKAVNKMQLISEYYEEHNKRWSRIAHVCGFQLSSPGYKSPKSQSPRESIPFVNHQDMLRFRYANRSVFQYKPELFHSSSSSPHFPLQPNPLTTSLKLHGESLTLLQGTTPNPTFHDLKRHSMTVVPVCRDLTGDRSVTDSIESTSSSSSSVSQLSGLVVTNTRSSLGGRTNGEVEEVLRRTYTDGGASERGSREGSVDTTRGRAGGRSQSGDSLEKKLVINRKRKVFEEVTQSSTEKARPSPGASPRQQSQGARRPSFNSTDV